MKKWPKPLSTTLVAKYCHVSLNTIHSWLKKGYIEAYTTPAGTFKILPEKFLEFLKKYDLPIPQEFKCLDTRSVLVLETGLQQNSVAGILGREFENLEITSVSDPLAACLKLGDLRPEVFILDTDTPGVDAAELIKLIRAEEAYDKIRLVLMQGKGREIKALDGDMVIHKSFDTRLLTEKLRELLFGKKC